MNLSETQAIGRLERTTEAIRTRAIEHTIAADKASTQADDLSEVRHQAMSEALVWALATLTGRDEAQVQVEVLMATDEADA